MPSVLNAKFLIFGRSHRQELRVQKHTRIILEQIPPKLKTLAIRICSVDIDLARILFGEVIPLRRDAL